MAYILVTLIIHMLFGQYLAAGPFTYTSQEIAALKMFRPMVKDVLYLDYMKRDEFLIKWIRDRSFDLNNANQKLRKSITWRKNTRVDEVLEDPSLAEFKSLLPYTWDGRDKFGSPIMTFKLGQDWNLRKIALAGKMQQAHRHMHGMMERASKMAREAGGNVTQYILIGSLANFNLKEHTCLGCIPFYSDFVINYEANYPETAQNLIPIYAPRIFDSLAQLIRSLMSPGTKKGFKILGYDRAEIQDLLFNKLFISPDQIRTHFGGTKPEN